MKTPTVCIVGRPNVGKSTLFNKLVGKKISIIEDTPGVTRDRIYGEATYKNCKFNLIDTGGIDVSKELFNDEIKVQVEIGILEADKIIFVVDGKEGLTANDYAVRDMLKKSQKEVIVAINKTDSSSSKNHIYDFYELGFDNYIEISAEQNLGIADLLDEIIRGFRKNEKEDFIKTKICVIGRPNVGKSSILNKLIKEDKAIVTSIAGTTRDTVEGSVILDGIQLNFIDTAGIRKTTDIVEQVGVEKSLKTIEEVDLVIVVLNNNEKLTNEDIDILEKTKDKKRIIVINKNDLLNKLDISKIKDNNIIYTNTLNYEGIESLTSKIKEMFNMELLDVKDFNYVSNVEQLNRLYDAKKSLEDVEKGLNNNLPIDMIEIDLKNIWTILGEIIGETYTDELLDNLFRDFCVGK